MDTLTTSSDGNVPAVFILNIYIYMFGLKTNIKGKIWIHLGAHPSNCSQNITIYCLLGDIGWYKSRVLSQWCLTFPFENNNDGFHLYIY